ncbi:hypothetical protein [Aliarcobacter lanthieri]|uniref:hypothetical protein n=1 Tax=Aliarcobacter lanthieri TaxID=1355374 RepID=UPI00047E2716|nr:hypothetical protein [Aliarcobacter lanthieri]
MSYIIGIGDKIYNFIEFSNPNKPTIYDEIKDLEGMELHNRLIFEFCIRNKKNQERIKSIINEYNNNKIKINHYIELINIVDSSGAMSLYEEYPYNYKSRVAFFNLKRRLTEIEFLNFDYYPINSRSRCDLIPSELFEIMNLIFEARKLYAKNTNEIQFDKIIDENTIECIGLKGHDMRFEYTNSSKFNVENRYTLVTDGFFLHESVVKLKKNDFMINPNYIHKVSLEVNLLADNDSIKKLIEDFISDLDTIKIEYEKALNKYGNIIIKENQDVDIIKGFYKRKNKNIHYAKLLYAYDMENKFSKEEIEKNFYKLFPEPYSKKPTEKLETFLNKSIFQQYLRKKLNYKTKSDYLGKELNKLKTMIDKKYYLKLI